ncbi:2103_t:CDS:2 [Diversispora eburnea]|uniref:2103_t:CDS:1 n=1 Tax=Diversispora eburnea TaxID=1213867 RepID=A0A9N9AZC5_9GLOM|nr:2103_t:CDS:2 [Diversispora eburnea]
MDRAKKVVNEKHENILYELSKQPGNDTCADCGAKGPRWASYNLGIFLCIRCCGFHRKMGTHISKVKSITLDSWTSEQIESMRQWGNLKANAKWNPRPELHPITLSASDGEIERYIRNKYERRAFQSTPKSKPNASITVKQTENSTKGSDRGNYDHTLRQLKEMGFTDMSRNREVLNTTNGDLHAAVEILCRLPGGNNSKLNSNTSSNNTSSNISNDEKLIHLRKLGYLDDLKNRDALQRTGGNLKVAITLLSESKSSASNDDDILRLSSPNNSHNSHQTRTSGQKDLSDIFFGETTQESTNLQQQQQKAKFDKNAIMSLYNAPQQSITVNNNMNMHSQFVTLGSGIVGMNSMGTLNSHPLNNMNNMNNAQLTFSNTTSMMPNVKMEQQKMMFGLQHTDNYSNGQQNKGFQQSSLL